MLDVIKKRRSHRDYRQKKLSREQIDDILRAAMFSPSARNQRLWEFIIVKDQKIKDLLAKTKHWSYFVNKAPIVIVIISKVDETDRYWLEDCFIATTTIYLEATYQKLGSCCVQIYGSKRDNGEDAVEYVRSVLGVPKNYQVACLMPVGYPAKKLSEHQESEFEKNKIHLEKF